MIGLFVLLSRSVAFKSHAAMLLKNLKLRKLHECKVYLI